MTIPGWDDEDDSYLVDIDWAAQEAQGRARLQQTRHHHQLETVSPRLQSGCRPASVGCQHTHTNSDQCTVAAVAPSVGVGVTHPSSLAPPPAVHSVAVAPPPPPPQQQQQQQQQHPASATVHLDARSIFFGLPPVPVPVPVPAPVPVPVPAPNPPADAQVQGHVLIPQPPLPSFQPHPQYQQQHGQTPAWNPPPPPPPTTTPQLQPQQLQQQQQATLPVVSVWATIMLPKANNDKAPIIEVSMGRNDAAYEALRKLGTGTFNQKRKAWQFPIGAHDKVYEALCNASGVRVHVDPLHSLPAAVLKSSSSIPDDSSRYCHIPTALESQLMEFQREGVKFGLRHGGRVLIGDEMGLGKTVQAIALASAYRDEWPGLIIAPSSLREQWADALHRWLGVTEHRVVIINSKADTVRLQGRLEDNSFDFLIISYNFLDKMDLDGYKLIVVDESHYIKDPSAKRTRAALPVLKEAKRCILLTGTPALNRPKEIYTQLSSLVPSARIRMKDFGERYCGGNRFDRYGGAINLDELHALLRGSVMVRRLKSEVLSQLPKKRRQQVFLSLDGEARKELSALNKQLDAVKSMLGQLAAMNAASGGAVALGGGKMEENNVIMEMYRRTAELKAKAVQEYVEMLLDAGQKFLIFAHHKDLMDAIEHSLNRRKGCRFIRIDGSTPASDRARLVNSFQEDDSIRVAVLSIKAAGIGLTLTAASTVVFAEMTWTPGEIIQAEDRAHRIGQACAVNVYFLHVRNSVDEIMWGAIQQKLDNVGQALDGQGRGTMEMARLARVLPDRGQKALDSYFVTNPANSTAVVDGSGGGGQGGGEAAAAQKKRQTTTAVALDGVGARKKGKVGVEYQENKDRNRNTRSGGVGRGVGVAVGAGGVQKTKGKTTDVVRDVFDDDDEIEDW